LSWRRLCVLVRYLPIDSHCRRAVDPENADWGISEQLSAAAVDALRAANWQRSHKGSRPKPIRRPGVDKHTTHGHTAGRSDAEVADYLARFKPPAMSEPTTN
jgi:hypothetical protein